MAKALSFDTGVREYEVNGGGSIRFNPTDTAFVDSFMDLIEALKEAQAAFEQGLNERTGGIESALDAEDDSAVKDASGAVTGYIADVSGDMRRRFDEVFGEGAADALFPGGMSLYALADGMPVWVNAVEAISFAIADAFDEEQGRQEPRKSAYSERYGAMMAKYRRKR